MPKIHIPPFKRRLTRLLLLLLALVPLAAMAAMETSDFTYARNLKIEHFPTYRLITVWNVNRDSQQRFHYALVPKGQRVPPLPQQTIVVRTPVQRVIVMSTTFIGYIDALNGLEHLIGVSNPELINHPQVRAQVAAGHTRGVQSGQSMDIESILLLQPDLILASSSGNPQYDIHPQLLRSGLPVVLSADYMEPHPLARSEWLRFVAAFFDAGPRAESIFTGIAQRYHQMKTRAQAVSVRPTVFCNATYSGNWNMPGGRSYTAQAIADAGGDYLWAENNATGSLPMDLERIFAKAADADIWLNPNNYQTMAQLLAADQRYARFAATQKGAVYNNCKQINAQGGNNIWERGVVHPDEVLADLIKIFHPSLMAEQQFNFYQQLH